MTTGAKIYIFLTFLTLFLFSCQSDEIKIIENEGENLISGSELAVQLMRVTQYPTSIDNILDNTNCFAVKLPVAVMVNGQPLFIETEEDYLLIEEIFNESSSDEDIVMVFFPATVILPDYSEVIIQNQQEWNQASNCTGFEAIGDLSCIRFGYPVSMNTYDVNNRIADVEEIFSKQELYDFITTMNEDTLAAVAYPIRILAPENIQFDSGDNELLLNAINQYEQQCGND